jgi:pyruvate,water dikinase
VTAKGDLIIAKIANLSREGMEPVLDQLGRLISFTRQMDAMLHTEEAVELYARNFIEEKY